MAFQTCYIQCFCLAMVNLARSRWRSLPATCNKAAQGDPKGIKPMSFFISVQFVHIFLYLWRILDFRCVCSGSIHPFDLVRQLPHQSHRQSSCPGPHPGNPLSLGSHPAAHPLARCSQHHHCIPAATTVPQRNDCLRYGQISIFAACGLVPQKLHVISCDIVLFL